jgi:hypothetical protein
LEGGGGRSGEVDEGGDGRSRGGRGGWWGSVGGRGGRLINETGAVLSGGRRRGRRVSLYDLSDLKVCVDESVGMYT